MIIILLFLRCCHNHYHDSMIRDCSYDYYVHAVSATIVGVISGTSFLILMAGIVLVFVCIRCCKQCVCHKKSINL